MGIPSNKEDDDEGYDPTDICYNCGKNLRGKNFCRKCYPDKIKKDLEINPIKQKVTSMEDVKNIDNWTTGRKTPDNHTKSSIKIKNLKCEICNKEFATRQRKETHESECKKIPKKTFEKDQEDIKIM